LQKTEPGVEYRNVISVKLNALGEDLK